MRFPVGANYLASSLRIKDAVSRVMRAHLSLVGDLDEQIAVSSRL